MVDRRIVSEKIAAVERSLQRIIERRGKDFDEFVRDEGLQDSVILHLMQAVQGCIDLAAHVVSDENLGLPSGTRDFFYILSDRKIIDVPLREKMIRAVGFRNLAAHEYAKLDLGQVYAIATDGLQDLEAFIRAIVGKFA